MARETPKRRLPRRPPLDAWTGTELTAGAKYERLRFSSLSLPDQPARGAAFREVEWRNLRLSGSDLSQCELLDLTAAECDLSNTRWDRGLFRRVEISGNRLVGLTAPDCILEQVLFKECDLKLAQFRFCRFKSVRFERCDLREADFAGSDLAGTTFKECQLQAVEMSQANAAEIDLRGSQIEDIKLLVTQMKGAKIDFDQAIYLIRLMGIDVGWDED